MAKRQKQKSRVYDAKGIVIVNSLLDARHFSITPFCGHLGVCCFLRFAALSRSLAAGQTQTHRHTDTQTDKRQTNKRLTDKPPFLSCHRIDSLSFLSISTNHSVSLIAQEPLFLVSWFHFLTLRRPIAELRKLKGAKT